MRKAVSLLTECGGSNVSVIATAIMFSIANAIPHLARAASHLALNLYGLTTTLFFPLLGVSTHPLLFSVLSTGSVGAAVAISETDE